MTEGLTFVSEVILEFRNLDIVGNLLATSICLHLAIISTSLLLFISLHRWLAWVRFNSSYLALIKIHDWCLNHWALLRVISFLEIVFEITFFHGYACSTSSSSYLWIACSIWLELLHHLSPTLLGFVFLLGYFNLNGFLTINVFAWELTGIIWEWSTPRSS